jgi:hypothetical protein
MALPCEILALRFARCRSELGCPVRLLGFLPRFGNSRTRFGIEPTPEPWQFCKKRRDNNLRGTFGNIR